MGKGRIISEWGQDGDQFVVILSGDRYPYKLTYCAGDPVWGQVWERTFWRWESAKEDYDRQCQAVDSLVASIQAELDRA